MNRAADHATDGGAASALNARAMFSARRVERAAQQSAPLSFGRRTFCFCDDPECRDPELAAIALLILREVGIGEQYDLAKAAVDVERRACLLRGLSHRLRDRAATNAHLNRFGLQSLPSNPKRHLCSLPLISDEPHVYERDGHWFARLPGGRIHGLVLVEVDADAGSALWGCHELAGELVPILLSWDPRVSVEDARASWDAEAKNEALHKLHMHELPDAREAVADARWDAAKEERL